MIRNRLIDTLRKTNREQEKEEISIEMEKRGMSNQNTEYEHAVSELLGISLEEAQMWQEVKKNLTEKQWD